MGNLLSKFRPPPRRRPLPGRCRPLVSPACSASHPVRHHPAAPAAPAAPTPSHCPGHRPFHRDRRPLPASFHVEPKRRYPLPQAVCSPVGLLPSVNWKDPPKTPVRSACTSIMCRPSRTVRIPPPRQKFTVLPSQPQQTVEAVKPKPSSYLPPSCPKALGEKVQEVPREGKEDLGDTRGPDDGNRAPHSSGDILLPSRPLETGGLLSSHQGSPAPGDPSPSPSGDSLGANTQTPRVSCPSPPTERPAVTLEGPAGDVAPLRKPAPEVAVLSDPTPGCPLLQETSTQKVVAENHRPSQSTPDLLRKVTEAHKPRGKPSEHLATSICHQEALQKENTHATFCASAISNAIPVGQRRVAPTSQASSHSFGQKPGHSGQYRGAGEDDLGGQSRDPGRQRGHSTCPFLPPTCLQDYRLPAPGHSHITGPWSYHRLG
ncbi:LOW QUALITY PROTEIN: nuclear pore-associated protein 1-like [Mustela erminea]|uniref:LOW QUALITY PROTEIN: nuclear pore-associated protein 1-like n=1 Tax=Mustela erminea TaxID=36723 RepID=UPI001386743B|nr:LOW QUALITY PROTEIN: nuclear pore-associated protein 1-like [Mustela erminea]